MTRSVYPWSMTPIDIPCVLMEGMPACDGWTFPFGGVVVSSSPIQLYYWLPPEEIVLFGVLNLLRRTESADHTAVWSASGRVSAATWGRITRDWPYAVVSAALVGETRRDPDDDVLTAPRRRHTPPVVDWRLRHVTLSPPVPWTGPGAGAPAWPQAVIRWEHT